MIFKVLPTEFVESYKDKEVPWGPLGYVVFKRTYARPLANGQTEEWYQTIERVVNGNVSLEMNHRGITEPEPWLVDEAKLMYDYMFNMKVLPGGRGLWASGTDIQTKHGGALTNCYYINVEPYNNDPTYPFCFAMDMLMVGAGVGYGVSKEFTDKLPVVKSTVGLNINCKVYHADFKAMEHLINTNPQDFTMSRLIDDSREGWVDALGRLIASSFEGRVWVGFDVSNIRPYGAPIAGFGGKASGPKPLVEMLIDINKIMNGAVGRKLTPTECMDIMCLIGRCVVAGNVRRCLPKGSMVYTDRGITPIENIVAGDLVHTQAGLKPVLNTFVQGKQSLVKIKTDSGWFECTPNHKMAVLRDRKKVWVAAKDLKVDTEFNGIFSDKLIKNTGNKNRTSSVAFLPSWSYTKPEKSTTCIDINIPNLDTEMAWFIGLFQADGYTYANKENNGLNAYVSVVVGLNELDIAERAKAQLERFGVTVDLSKRKNESSYQLRVQSKQLAWYLHDNIKKPNASIDIPHFIRNSNYDIKLAYLSGVLDGDGAANNKPVQLVSTVYKSFAEQLFSLANYVGLQVKLKEAGNWPSRPANWQKQYFVTLVDNESREKIEQYSSKSLRRTKKYNKRQESVVLSVESVDGVFDTYDIEVADEHEFYCNGYLTHNSAEIALGDVTDTEFVTAKTWGDDEAKNAVIANHRWASNNSVVVSKPEDIDGFIDALLHNGEPGFFNREMHQNYGRLVDGVLEVKDNGVGCNPCAEQTLASGEPCNLADIVLPNINTLQEANTATIIAMNYTKRVTLSPYVWDIAEKMVNKNRRVGIGVTGVVDVLKKQYEPTKFNIDTVNLLQRMYFTCLVADYEISKRLQIAPSIKLTTVKPSGTLSLLAGCSPGVHYPVFKTYIRRIQFSDIDPLVPWLESLGFESYVPERLPNAKIVKFPVKSDAENTERDVTFADKLNLQCLLQKYWADNSVSCTLTFQAHEHDDVKRLLKERFYELKSTSALPISNIEELKKSYPDLPYEPITEEQYDEMVSKIKALPGNVRFDGNASTHFTDDGSDCVGGSCPVR